MCSSDLVIQVAFKRGGKALLGQFKVFFGGSHRGILLIPITIPCCYCTPHGGFSQPEKGPSSGKIQPEQQKQKKRSLEYFPNFPPSIFYTNFVQNAIPWGEKFGGFSAKLLSIFLTIHWKFHLVSVIMDCANTNVVIILSRRGLDEKTAEIQEMGGFRGRSEEHTSELQSR